MGLLSKFNPMSWGRRSAPIQRPAQVSAAVNRRMIKARFDNQFTTEDNKNHWALADVMSVDASASWHVRRILRARGRYEYHNNPFMMGASNRLARFVIGTGPRLHVSTGNKGLDSGVQDSFSAWARKIHLARKLRTSRASRFHSGEGFGLLRTNPLIDHPVKLDLFEIECDQVSSPLFGLFPANYPDQYFDGVTLDPWGNPEVYQVLRQHPGAFGAFVMMGYEFDPWPARYVLHDFSHVRPGQQRGIPECVPALDLFAELRRYRKAVLAAAETAADHAGFLKSEAPADDADEPDPMDTIAIKRRMMTVLPSGWDAFQMKAEQPTTAYDDYTMSLLLEASQTLDMPLFIFTGDARLANMSSAYVATQSFVKSVVVDRQEYENLLDRTLAEFLEEARYVRGLLPRDLPRELPHAWRWDRISNHADPAKMASAQGMRLSNGTSSIPREAALEGCDWEEEQEADAKALGMTLKEYRAATREKRFMAKGTIVPAAGGPQPGDQGGDGDEGDEGGNDKKNDKTDEESSFGDGEDE